VDILSDMVACELQALEHTFSQFDNGEEFINPRHAFSFDLDLFGDGSLFQFLNRTSTISGKNVLAEWLQSPLLTKEKIQERQNVIAGFLLNSLFLWDIRCIYRLHKWHSENSHKLIVWLETAETTDALISQANYADNHPLYVFPEIVSGSFVLKTKNLGHGVTQTMNATFLMKKMGII